MNKDQNEILAALAVGYQRVDDRQVVIEELLKESIIIPGSKVNNILLCATLITVLLCLTFCFVWYFGG